MENLDMFQDIIGGEMDIKEELEKSLIDGFKHAVSFAEGQGDTDPEVIEFLNYVSSCSDELIQLHLNFFDTEELKFFIQLERNPISKKIKQFQLEVMNPKMQEITQRWIQKKEDEADAARQARMGARRASLDDRIRRIEEDSWDTENEE